MWGYTPCDAAVRETAATEISRWIHTFAAMHVWVSDKGSHFKNRVMELLAPEHRVNHHFKAAYIPWVNGTVNNENRRIQVSWTALLTELKLAPHDWPRVIPLITLILNEAPSHNLGKRSKGSFHTSHEETTGIQSCRNVLVCDIPLSSML